MDVKPIPTSTKPPIVRGARACTVCRAAKMKCVGAEDGAEKCQRCQRTGNDCVFEKHKRGRKPGSKLSEASKMLRRLEKGLNNAKLKSQQNKDSPQDPASTSYTSHNNRNHPPHLRGFDQTGSGGDPTEAYPATHPGASPSSSSVPLGPGGSAGTPGMGGIYGSRRQISISSSAPNSMEEDTDPMDPSRPLNDTGIFPAKLIRSEKKSSFFRTILNPEPSDSPGYRSLDGSSPATPAPIPSPAPGHPQHPGHPPISPPSSVTPIFSTSPDALVDPIDAGLITKEHALDLWDYIFLRLNPFVNLFDPVLHTLDYVRGRCPFLFTTLIMAACKFFNSDQYQACLKLANEYAARAFIEGWKRVEVVQAFACLTYWRDMNLRDPNENRTWTYIGYACRMAVELDLNRYVAQPSPTETTQQRLERRNRERTYLILFVHDRSLSTQTGKPWMLQECDLVRNSNRWHEHNGAAPSGEDGDAPIRPEDVILASFVQLRRIVAETTEHLLSANASASRTTDVNHDGTLKTCNARLQRWSEDWKEQLERAYNVQPFHWSSLSPSSRARPNLEPLYSCFSYAIDVLKIVSEDFAKIDMLSYSQDSIAVMTAYATVFLVRLVRSPTTVSELDDGAAEATYARIRTVSAAYHKASQISPACLSISYHSRFLIWLIQDGFVTSSSGATPTATTGGSSTRRSSSAIGGAIKQEQYPDGPMQVLAPQPVPAYQPSGSVGNYYPNHHIPHSLDAQSHSQTLDHSSPYNALPPSQNSNIHPSSTHSPHVPVHYGSASLISGHSSITPHSHPTSAPLLPSHPHVPQHASLHPQHSPSPHGHHSHHSPHPHSHPLAETHTPHAGPTQTQHPSDTAVYYANPHQMPHHHQHGGAQRTEQDDMYWKNIIQELRFGDQAQVDPRVMQSLDQYGQYHPGMRHRA
ncbi:fungal-specific transcription factor domain-containing protein [Pterulicium gracile]|uniref:Fungal-specific transcription factor domain-containing protein n=1 Tax=Pterulicium gracile TaxID=1884261 RepID=A0A5C3QY59_9AGAR|nr:fungal-specific transcription factor domain-containing protein [Pterula gracilis]